MIQDLVVNGCSYSESYAKGGGHVDLAARLSIPTAHSLAIGGSANSRIIRTTLKHSYQTNRPTFYVLGMTFLSRNEIPILLLDEDNDFEGRWTNPQNQQFRDRWDIWTDKDTERYIDLKLKSEMYSISDRLEDLQYKIISMISDLHRRGHKVLVFQQADNLHLEHIDNPKFDLFRATPEIIGGYSWCAINWQHENNVLKTVYGPDSQYVPPEMTHPAPGAHDKLNAFLTNYIQEHKILA